MKTITYQLIGHKDKESLSEVLTCNVNPAENDANILIAPSKRKTDWIIRIGDMVMVPRRFFIFPDRQSEGMLGYGVQQGSGWSMTSFFVDVKIISIEDAACEK